MTGKKKKENLFDTVDKTVRKSVFNIADKKPKQTYILFLKGELLGQLISLKNGSTILGRNPDVEVPLEDSSVSREHLRITVSGEKAIIKDLGSTNGTYVNNNRITEYALKDGDKIQISPSTIFKFVLSDESERVFHDELYRMGVIDPVTNVYNKRYFTERFKQEFSHASRYKTEFSLMMIDIDFFKKINDTHGHLAGDFVLGSLSEMFSNSTRNVDIVARYGGEEFAIILPETGEEGAAICAERIREKVAETQVMFDDRKINVTVSIGIVTLSATHPFKNDEGIIQAADRCLYYSKEYGRNRTTCLSQIKA